MCAKPGVGRGWGGEGQTAAFSNLVCLHYLYGRRSKAAEFWEGACGLCCSNCGDGAIDLPFQPDRSVTTGREGGTVRAAGTKAHCASGSSHSLFGAVPDSDIKMQGALLLLSVTTPVASGGLLSWHVMSAVLTVPLPPPVALLLNQTPLLCPSAAPLWSRCSGSTG